MDNERIELLSQDLWRCVRQMLNAEPDVPAVTAALVANAVQRAFVKSFKASKKAYRSAQMKEDKA